MPFLVKHNVSAFFWPDLACCHYSKATLEWYKAKKVIFVPREVNPPNCSELRPIERYWALVKRKLKNMKKVVKNEAELRTRWREASGKVDETIIKSMMLGVSEKINNFVKN